MECCPICSVAFTKDEIESHVNDCLESKPSKPRENLPEIGYSHFEEDREFALRLIVEEERQKKLEEANNQRLLLELLEKEQRDIQTEVETCLYTCPRCKKTLPIEEMYYMDSCTHMFCKSCLRQMVLTKIEVKCISDIRCLESSCKSSFSQRDFVELLSKSEHEHFLAVSVQELIDSSSSFVRCPNKQCGNAIERVKSQEKVTTKEMGPDGKTLSSESIKHRNEYRFRCRECNTEFCSSCQSIPYHLGFTCDKFKEYQKAEHCRFCGVQLAQANCASHPRQLGQALRLVCSQKECLVKRENSCSRLLSCNHNCGGIYNEEKCLPCLECDANKDRQKNSDYCNICWVEDLGSAPCIELDCGHIFHYSCATSKIANGWAGARISFGFLDCALCKKQMLHPSLTSHLKPMQDLFEQVKAKAVQRLQFMNLENCKEITTPQSPYFNAPEKYAIYRFSYFICYKCTNPYFGGERACEGNQVAEFDPKELVCGGCSDSSGKDNCPKHGNDYIEYKCKFCCNIAIWFCWGNTHFCDECHKKASTIPKVPKKDLPKCTCKFKHPPNGEEFSLGCGLCPSDSF